MSVRKNIKIWFRKRRRKRTHPLMLYDREKTNKKNHFSRQISKTLLLVYFDATHLREKGELGSRRFARSWRSLRQQLMYIYKTFSLKRPGPGLQR